MPRPPSSARGHTGPTRWNNATAPTYTIHLKHIDRVKQEESSRRRAGVGRGAAEKQQDFSREMGTKLRTHITELVPTFPMHPALLSSASVRVHGNRSPARRRRCAP